MTATAAPLLQIQHLQASYRGAEGAPIRAVRDVSFDLYPGEVLALVGESAAGKSSVAHAILGLLPGNATIEGDVRYRGQSLKSLSREELRRVRGERISMIFQDPLASLTPTLTVGVQLAEVFSVHRGLSKAEAREEALAALRRVLPDPERVADLYPFQLSGGMAQRVMIGMALALRPDVIIADEATSSLDAATRMDTIARLEELRDQGAGVLLITHDFGVVARLADRVVVMYAGAIAETGDVSTIFKKPRHPYTYGLLQSLPRLDRRATRIMPMRGQPPDLAKLGEECAFLPRCPKATSQCRTELSPPLVVAGTGIEGHMAACYNPVAIDRAEELEFPDAHDTDV